MSNINLNNLICRVIDVVDGTMICISTISGDIFYGFY